MSTRPLCSAAPTGSTSFSGHGRQWPGGLLGGLSGEAQPCWHCCLCEKRWSVHLGLAQAQEIKRRWAGKPMWALYRQRQRAIWSAASVPFMISKEWGVQKACTSHFFSFIFLNWSLAKLWRFNPTLAAVSKLQISACKSSGIRLTFCYVKSLRVKLYENLKNREKSGTMSYFKDTESCSKWKCGRKCWYCGRHK